MSVRWYVRYHGCSGCAAAPRARLKTDDGSGEWGWRMGKQRAWAGMAVALAVLAVSACSGGKKDTGVSSPAAGSGVSPTATASPTAAAAQATAASGGAATAVSMPAVAADCLKGLRSYRYSATVKLKLPADAGGGVADALGDISMSGAFVAPDRSQVKVTVRGLGFETVAIGSDTWTRVANGSWTKSTGGNSDVFAFTPETFCSANLADLGRAQVTPSRERVNGRDALKYEFDKQALSRLHLFGGSATDVPLPDNTRLVLWVTEKERWPIKLVATGDQTSGPDAVSFDFQFSVTDLNSPDIKVEAPT